MIGGIAMKDNILRGLLYGYGLYRIGRVFWILGFFGYESTALFVGELIGAALTAVLCVVCAGLIRRVNTLEERICEQEEKELNP